jgi:hypothetical protein
VPVILRLEVMDVDPIPPDDSLGYAELDVALVVPHANSTWEQWLPLREGGTGEVLVRLTHLSASAAAQGPLPLPRAFTAQEEVVEQQRAAVGAAATGAAGRVTATSTVDDAEGAAAAAEVGQAIARVNQAVSDSLNAQVRLCVRLSDPEELGWGGALTHMGCMGYRHALKKRSCVQYAVLLRLCVVQVRAANTAGEELRFKLQHSWVPKMQARSWVWISYLSCWISLQYAASTSTCILQPVTQA